MPTEIIPDGFADPNSTETENVILAAHELEFVNKPGGLDNIAAADCKVAAKILRAVVSERDILQQKLTAMEAQREL